MVLSSFVSKTIARPRSTVPWDIAQKPMTMTMSRPVSSTSVSTTLNPSDSDTPRRLMSASKVMKASAMKVTPPVPHSRPKPTMKFSPRNFAAVDAEVRPELSTAKVTRNVTMWSPKALWVYSAAPAACGYYRHQLQVGEGGDGGHREGEQDRGPAGSAHLAGHLTGEGVDPGAEDVTDDEQQEQLGPMARFSSGCAGVWGVEMPIARSSLGLLVQRRFVLAGQVCIRKGLLPLFELAD